MDPEYKFKFIIREILEKDRKLNTSYSAWLIQTRSNGKNRFSHFIDLPSPEESERIAKENYIFVHKARFVGKG